MAQRKWLGSYNKKDFTDPVTVLYGHNMKNGSMFAALMGYKDQAFYEEHPAYAFVTPEKNYIVEIFACFTISDYGNAWETNFENDESFRLWLEAAKRQSMIRSEVEPKAEDCIMTLSTCTYEYDDARFVVMGVLREAE